MLTVGDVFTFEYQIPESKVVPNLYPESPEFQAIPPVFATGFMVGLLEWTCIKHLDPTLSEDQTSLGIAIETTHSAASTPGMTVRVKATVLESGAKKVKWALEAHDDVELIGSGTHTRAIVNAQRFIDRVNAKAEQCGATSLS